MTLDEIRDITKNLQLLYVEDEIELQKVTASTLSMFFPNITCANNGEEGLEIFNQGKFDLVITDISMPKLDGLSMIKQMRKLNPDLDVVIFSAMNDPKQIVESLKLNIDGYLFKPLSIDKFKETLENVFSKELIKLKVSNYSNQLNSDKLETTSLLNSNHHKDELTGLENIVSLMDTLNNRDPFVSPVVILLNIDQFKVFNQLYSIEVGNKVLIKLSTILQEFAEKKGYKLYRINADEFVLLDLIEYMDITKYETDMVDLFDLDLSFFLDNIDEKIEVDLTAGISFSSTDTLKKANMALYEARKRGRNFIGFSYDIDYTEELQSNLFWRQEIKRAIEENRVVAFYQPIVDREGKIVQYESLIRIKKIHEDGTLEYLTPGDFLDISLMTKQYLVLTKFMIESTLKKMFEKQITISVNLTFQDVRNDDIYASLKDNIKKYHLEHMAEFDFSHHIIFEILEHEGIDCYQSFVDFIKEFKDMGVKIALDDFGTGFSNFSHITALSPDFIKIDGQLISNIHKDEKAYSLVKAIVKFSKELGVKTIAEHVHSKEIFDVAYELQIDKFQGFYFGEPTDDI